MLRYERELEKVKLLEMRLEKTRTELERYENEIKRKRLEVTAETWATLAALKAKCELIEDELETTKRNLPNILASDIEALETLLSEFRENKRDLEKLLKDTKTSIEKFLNVCSEFKEINKRIKNAWDILTKFASASRELNLPCGLLSIQLPENLQDRVTTINVNLVDDCLSWLEKFEERLQEKISELRKKTSG